jgi:F0F1-type ATP synthase membrane subunit b/b'
MPILTVGKPLREKLGDEAVESLINLINESQVEQKNGILEFVEEKFERRLSEEISKTRTELNQKISETAAELNQQISKTRVELSETRAELIRLVSETRADLIKWMFIFWVGQVGMMLGILFAFFKR